VAKSGRYGKYGEIKRLARLRQAGDHRRRKSTPDFEPSSRFEQKRTKPFLREQIKMIPAGISDAAFIRNLSRQVFSIYGRYDETLTRWFLSGITITILASMSKRYVGFAMLGRSGHSSPFSRVYELLAIAVEPKLHRRGIGSLLMRNIEARARELNVETLVLHTAADNIPGQSLFEKCGFFPSETKNCFYPEGQDALMMYKDLG